MRAHCKSSSLALEEACAAKRAMAQACLLIHCRQSLTQALTVTEDASL